jgi:PAS domain S-box-containing protein
MPTSENSGDDDARETTKKLTAELEALRFEVTEIKQSRSDLESQFLQMTMNLPGVVYQRTLHPDGTITYPFVSPGIHELYGYEDDEVKADPSILQKSIVDEDQADYREALAASIQSKSEWQWVGRVKTSDGRLKWVKDSACLRASADGCVHWDGLILDVSDGAGMDLPDALRESEERFRALFENAPTSIYVKDLQGRYTLVNPAFEEWTGFTSAGALGKTVKELFPELTDKVVHQDLEVIETQIPSEQELEVVHPDGTVRTMLTKKFPILDARGAVNSIGSISIDFSERLAAELQLHQSQKMEAVGQLTGGIAHDFNNLLSVISMNLELLMADRADDQALHEAIELALRATRRGAELTSSLLAFSRRQTLRPVATDVNEMVGGMSELLTRTLGESISIETILSDGLWVATVDRGQLEASLLNLAINARDAMPTGGEVTIETANVTLDEDYAARHEDVSSGPHILIAVSDTGTGMSPETLNRVFEPFYSTKEPGKGSGLGMSMVYGFVKQSSGHINLYSELGHGTTVKIYLPRSDEVVVATEGPASTELEPRGNGELILVVEDDLEVRSSVVRLLVGLGYRTIEGGSAEEALALLAETPEVSLLFTDVVLPGGMNGMQLAHEALQRQPGLNVLFTSGYTKNAIVHHGRLDDGVELLEKPYRKKDLAQRVRALLA